MRVIIVANVEQQQEIASKNTNPETDLVFIRDLSGLTNPGDYDALFYLPEDQSDLDPEKLSGNPVFINSVIKTLEQNRWPINFSRINGWNGFLQKKTWEVASGDTMVAGKVFEELKWNVVFVNDEPGFVSCRVISMIINEAFFALEEGVSTRAEIDLAMKLGTNYPHGPFEWADKIGLQNIYLLLKSLSSKDKRYSVATLLEREYLQLSDPQKI